ncbi:MAG: lipase [Arthrospira sp. SH-MAG29]|nr:lipase [Arthrospira sp. SH-MAG29]MBS0015563.1 lipase [Arthrospira sp. SH-MAG29]
MIKKQLFLYSTMVATLVIAPGINQPSSANLPLITSPEFESLCRSGNRECAMIGKASHLTTQLIYELFDAEKTGNPTQRQQAIANIATLYQTESDAIKVVNTRLNLSDFFILEKDQVLGGYAVFLSRGEIIAGGIDKVSFVIGFKGLYPSLEDPNDIAVAVSALPEHLYHDAGALIHQGFRDYSGSVFNHQISQEMINYILQLQDNPKTHVEIVVTGHSLGGSAILYAGMLVDAGINPENLKVIVFGSGPVAQASFISQYPDLIPKIIRIETPGDMLLYDDDSPMKPIYQILGYVPFGRLIKATGSDRLNQLNQQLAILQQQQQISPSPDFDTKRLNLLQQILQERVAIHVYSYRYYYQIYRSHQGGGGSLW